MAHSPDHYDRITPYGVTRVPVTYSTSVVHACSPGDSAFTPCCNRTPFGLPYSDRLTLDAALVTCGQER